MKAQIIFSFFSLILAISAIGQVNDCKIELRTPTGTPTETEFYIFLGEDKIQSNGGILKIEESKISIYKDSLIKIHILDEEIFKKLYKLPPFVVSAKPLKDICNNGVFTLERRF